MVRVVSLLSLAFFTLKAFSASLEVTFSQSTDHIERYNFVEVTLKLSTPSPQNPFTSASVQGRFGFGDDKSWKTVEGFCDSQDGTVYRVRFMPAQIGDYRFSVSFRQGEERKTFDGTFKSVESSRRGPVAVDPQHRWHFIWKGTGEHYFLNGTTAFFLMGWDDENIIRQCIDRLRRLQVNRVRVLLDGRSDHFWTEPIKPGNGFNAHLEPWVPQRPNDIKNPGFDYSRFNVSYWEKFERMLMHARAQDVIISVIFGWNDTPVHPAADSEDERRYFQYAVSRLSSFSNLTWDLGDDLDGFRNDDWTHRTGTALYDLDVYHHLATSHPASHSPQNEHQDRTSLWFGMTSFQRWDRPLHDWMLQQRVRQAATGRIIPQVNEEYGYEDHYPTWAPYKAPAASADADRRTAWAISMAGCYQTTGETAKRGTGVLPDTGGGWVNGRGDDTMQMLVGYAHMVRFFTSLDWWLLEPHDELAATGAFCLADPGRVYVAYLPHGGDVALKVIPAKYQTKWFNPANGEFSIESNSAGPRWSAPPSPNQEDWVLLLNNNPNN